MKKIIAVGVFSFILSSNIVFAAVKPAVSLPAVSLPKPAISLLKPSISLPVAHVSTLGKVQNMNPLTLSRSVVGLPMISVYNYIVWEDIRNNSTTGRDIYGLDNNTGVEFAICTETGNQTFPYIDGNVVTWTDTRSGHSGISYYYIDAKREIRVNSSVNRYVKGISGNYILAMEYQTATGDFELVAYNYLSTQPKTIASSLTLASSAAIDGNIVVWTDSKNGNSTHVYAYDLSLNKEIVVSTSTTRQSEPTVSEGMVVWKDYRSNSSGDIWGYDISTKKEFLVYSTAGGIVDSPYVGKRYVVFEKDHKIYAYHIDTKILSALVSSAHDYANPSIKNNVVVWTNDEGGYGGNIFTTTLPDVPAVESFVVGDGAAQRFYVDKLQWILNTDTNISQLISDGGIVNAVKIANLGTRAKTAPVSQELKLSVSDFSYSTTTRTLTWSYHATSTDKSMLAGLYRATLFASSIVSGDNTHPVTDIVNYFHSLKGDVNGDMTVNASDLIILQNAFGSKPGDSNWNSNADLDRNSVIDFMDYLGLKSVFGAYVEGL